MLGLLIAEETWLIVIAIQSNITTFLLSSRR